MAQLISPIAYDHHDQMQNCVLSVSHWDNTVGINCVDDSTYIDNNLTTHTFHQDREIERLKIELEKKEDKKKLDLEHLIGYYYARN